MPHYPRLPAFFVAEGVVGEGVRQVGRLGEEETHLQACADICRHTEGLVGFPEKLRKNLSTWRALASPGTPWAVDLLEHGFHLSAPTPISQQNPPRPFRGSVEGDTAISIGIEEMLAVGAAEELQEGPQCGAFLSNLFTVPKPGSDKLRPVLDCRAINEQVDPPPHFRMEGIRDLRALIHQGDFLTKVDLRKAYWHVPCSTKTSRWLAFQWRGRVYRSASLPFGVAAAPYTFTKLMRPVVEELRRQGIRVVVYLDDLLVIARTQEESRKHTQAVLRLLVSLGFTISQDKCILAPSRRLVFLGLLVDTSNVTLAVPEERLALIVAKLASIGSRPRVKTLASLIGSLISCRDAVEPAYLWTTALTRAKQLAVNRGGWHGRLWSHLPHDARQELAWWTQNIRSLNGLPLSPVFPTWTINTDASEYGWGAVLRVPGQPPRLSRGYWTAEQRLLHINGLEIGALEMGIMAFRADVTSRPLVWESDSQVALACVRKWKARTRRLLPGVRRLWQLCRGCGIRLVGKHVPGVDNVAADELSREWDTGDWRLNPLLFEQCCRLLQFRPEVDAFASAANKQVTTFWSALAQPGATAIDAFAQSWRGVRVYANPPFSCVGRMLHLVRAQRATAMVVLPVWRGSSWWPLLLSLLKSQPLVLPQRVDTFLPGAVAHFAGRPKWQSWVLLISGAPHTRRPVGLHPIQLD